MPWKKIVELQDEAKSVGPDRQAEIAKEINTIWVDNLYDIGTIGLTAMDQGVAVVNKNLRNVPGKPDQGLGAAHARQRQARESGSSLSKHRHAPGSLATAARPALSCACLGTAFQVSLAGAGLVGSGPAVHASPLPGKGS